MSGGCVTRGPAAAPAAGVPAREQPLGHVLDGQGERPVVAPPVLDVQEPHAQALVAEPELLDDAQRRTVLGADVDLDAVQAQGAEAVVGGERDGGRRDAAPGHVLGHPVADRGRAQRPVGDRRDRELPDERAVEVDRERERRARAGLRGQGAHERAERRAADRSPGSGSWRPTAPASRR